MKMQFIEFDSFFNLANWFYISIGFRPYERNEGQRSSLLLDLLFFVHMFNMNFVLLSELIYVFLALKNNTNFVEATMNLSYIGFVFVGDIKIWNIWYRRQCLTQVIRDLLKIYPKTQEIQKSYQVESFRLNCNRITFAFALIHQILIWTYNFFAIVTYLIYDYWLQQRVVELVLPYYCYVPWDWHNHWSYYALYASQNLAGHTCVAGQIASDILLCATATQLIMHYQYLAKRIAEQLAQSDARSLDFLTDLVSYHHGILRISDAINEVFGFSLLVNLFSSSFIMCFLGFQMTIGVDTTIIVMLFLFLFCSLVQVYMISNYAQDLITASESIGHAVYNHDWHDADVRYKKMLVLIIKRAQKPAVLKATSFLSISLGTMTDLMQLSYKFFALLRTMYSK